MDLKELINKDNIIDYVDDEDDLKKLGAAVKRDYDEDKGSRAEWEAAYDEYMALALQVQEVKNFPWENSANIKYPLLTTAGLQFHARAYPSLVPGGPLVQAKVIRPDPDGELRKRAERVARHMTYQLIDQQCEWEEDMDKLLLTYAFTGCEFKKTYFDPDRGYPVSEWVSSKDLVVNYWAKDIDKVDRKTHRIFYDENARISMERAGLWRKIDYTVPTGNEAESTVQDEVTGRRAPSTDSSTPDLYLEYHGFADLDEDGYREPYIITVHYDTAQVVRIVARFSEKGIKYNDYGEVVRVEPDEYFTKYDFIPDPSGGMYGIGFGVLLAPINQTVNTAINQVLDAGTMSNLQAGFISRNLRVKNGNIRLAPGEWKQLNATPEDMRYGVMPLPVREPSSVLQSLIEYMVRAGERLSSTTDLMVGENPGQNQKATTTMAVREEGLKVFTAIYKRTRRAMDREYKKLYKLNSLYLDMSYIPNNPDYPEEENFISRADYTDDMLVVPSSDPRIATEAQKMQRAEMLMNLIGTGGFNVYAVKRRLLEAADIPNIEEVLPDPQGPNALPAPPPPPEAIKTQADVMHQHWQEAFDEWKQENEFLLQEREQEIQIATLGGQLTKDAQEVLHNWKRLEFDFNAAEEAKGGESGNNEGNGS